MPPDFINSTHTTPGPSWKTLAEFSLLNQPRSDRLAEEQALEVLKELGLSRTNRNRLKAAISKAILNTIEPDHQQSERQIRIRVLISEPAHSGQKNIWGQKLIPASPTPDPVSLLSGQPLQPGWGFFLIHKAENLEQTQFEESYYLIELFLYREDDLSELTPMTGEVP